MQESPDALIQAMRQTARQNAASNWTELQFGGFDPHGNQYGFADLRPTHLGLTNTTYFGEWSVTAIAAAGVGQDWFNTTVHENTYILIYGVFNNTPNPRAMELRFLFGGNELTWSQLQEIYGWDITRAYFEQGWVVSPEQAIRAVVTANAVCAAQTEFLGLLGEVLGKRSYMIQFNAPAP